MIWQRERERERETRVAHSTRILSSIFTAVVVACMMATTVFAVTIQTPVNLTSFAGGDSTTHSHVWVQKYDANNHWDECSMCGVKQNMTAHTVSVTYTDGEGNCLPTNREKTVCLNCAYTTYTYVNLPHVFGHVSIYNPGEAGETGLSETGIIPFCKNCGWNYYWNDGKLSKPCYDANGNLIVWKDCTGPVDLYHKEDDGSLTLVIRGYNQQVRQNFIEPEDFSLKYELIENGDYIHITGTIDLSSYSLFKEVQKMSTAPSFYLQYGVYFTKQYGSAPGWPSYNQKVDMTTGKAVVDMKIPGRDITQNYLESIRIYPCWIYTVFGDSETGIYHIYRFTPKKPDEAYIDTNVTNPTITSASVTTGDKVGNFTKQTTIAVKGNIVGSYYGYATVTEKATGKVLYQRAAFPINSDNSYTASLELKGVTTLGGKAVVTIEDYFGKSVTTEVTLPTIDNEAPNISNIKAVNVVDGWAQSKDLTLYVSDSGIGTTYVALNKSGDSDFVAVPDGQITWRLTGNVFTQKNLCVFVKDGLGNMQSYLIPIDKLDNTSPTISGTSIDPSVWTNNDVKLSVTASDVGGGLDASGYKFNSEDWQTSNFTYCKTNGKHIVTVRDVAGNTRTTTRSIVTIDKEAPTFTVSGNPATWTGSDVTLSISATDMPASGCSGLHAQAYSFDGGATWQADTSKTFSENGTYTLMVRDSVGNVSKGQDITIRYIDKTPPAAHVEGIPTAWQNTDAIIHITASDLPNQGSGLDAKPYSWDNGLTWTNSSSLTVSQNQSLRIKVRDAVGNILTLPVTEITFLDKEPPEDFTVSASPTAWTAGSVTLTVSGASDKISGLADLPYHWTAANADYGPTSDASYEITENGDVIVSITDKAGNIRSKKVSVTNIDKTAPSDLAIVGDTATWTNQPVTVSATAKDTQSGVTEFSWNNGLTWQTDSTITFNENTEGILLAKDAVGNISEPFQYTITCVDKEAPELTVVFSAASSDFKEVITQLYGTDAGGSKVKDFCWDYDKADGTGEWTSASIKALTSGVTVTVAVRDHAGNVSFKDVTPKAYEMPNGGGNRLQMISDRENGFSVEKFILGPDKYIDASGNAHDYEDVTIVDRTVTGLPAQVTARSRYNGYVTGYAKLDGKKYPIYWNLSTGSTSIQSENTFTGTFVVDPADFTVSKKTATLTVCLMEYSAEDLTEKINEDSASTQVSIDKAPPIANITYNPLDNKVTISVKDLLSGVGEVLYKTPASTDWQSYTGPFNLDENGVIVVKTTDRTGNVTAADVESIYIERPGTADPVTGEQATFRTHWFNYYLHGARS